MRCTILGFEASAVGKLTDQWQVIASYQHLFKAEITRTSVAAQLGKTPTNTPIDAFSLWTTYDVTEKFQVGGGAFYMQLGVGRRHQHRLRAGVLAL